MIPVNFLVSHRGQFYVVLVVDVIGLISIKTGEIRSNYGAEWSQKFSGTIGKFKLGLKKIKRV